MTEFCEKCSLEGHTEESVDCYITRMERKQRSIIAHIQSLPRNEVVILLSRELNDLRCYMIFYVSDCRFTRESYAESINKCVTFDLQHNLGDITEEITRQRKQLADLRKIRETYVKYTTKVFEKAVSMQEELIELCSEYSSEELEMADIANGYIDGIKRTAVDYIKAIKVEYEYDETLADDKTTECDCPLCYETIYGINAIARKECGHKHCIDCFKKYLTSIKETTSNPTCSICRQEIKNVVSGNPFIVDEFIEFTPFLI